LSPNRFDYNKYRHIAHEVHKPNTVTRKMYDCNVNNEFHRIIVYSYMKVHDTIKEKQFLLKKNGQFISITSDISC
jgi:hypothetical protein